MAPPAKDKGKARDTSCGPLETRDSQPQGSVQYPVPIESEPLDQGTLENLDQHANLLALQRAQVGSQIEAKATQKQIEKLEVMVTQLLQTRLLPELPWNHQPDLNPGMQVNISQSARILPGSLDRRMDLSSIEPGRNKLQIRFELITLNLLAIGRFSPISLAVDCFTRCAPAYAILSHNWEDEEVTLHQLDDLDAASSLKGFKKLKNVCAIAKADGYKWIWVDTCCIDKTSSSELSEAINSMFQWYQQAGICYAHISDVSDIEFNRTLDSRTPYFPQCRWLTRGWTLQELIAPQELRFYSQNWKMVGSKALFAQILSHATGIPPEVLKAGDVSGITVREKMKWIASRETTLPEDVAYCALGIFDINMPLLYGEGKEKAFRRLQKEILRVTDDPTIFLWTADYDESDDFWGLLARSPSQFKRTPMGIDGL